MCTCNHSTQCSEEYYSALEETDPSIAETSWRTTQDRSTESGERYCTAQCSAQAVPFSHAPITIPTGNLSWGLAVARRLDFGSYQSGTDDSSEFVVSGLSEDLRRLRRGESLLRSSTTPEEHPVASSSLRTPPFSPERSRIPTLDRSYVGTPERSRAAASPQRVTPRRPPPRIARGTYSIDRRRRPFEFPHMAKPPPLGSTKTAPCVKCLRI
ncbi:uncharacterized protein LOC117221770 [Megalopta genalis]|uniref:uncharacterized protein LOC117221770 n=1 Tax=Megalopta genalis TaxID=115081 RepID=UPI003FD189DD